MRGEGLTGCVWRVGYGSALAGLLLMAGPGPAVGAEATAPATTPALRINDVSRAEGNAGSTAFSFTVRLSPASDTPVKVKYATADGSAKASSDYSAARGTLTFEPGQTSRPLTVKVRGDAVRESNETFDVKLSAPTGAILGDAQGKGTILNDDGPVLRINDLAKAEGNSGTTRFSFTVSLSPPSNSLVRVNYATANGTALAGSDYTAASGTLIFNAGQTTRPLVVSVRGDAVRESNETFVVNLSAPSGATLFDGRGQGTIQNDDGLMLRRLNDTGITRCANGSQNGLNCPVTSFPGQDAEYGRDRTHNDPSDGHAGFSFTKIANSGQQALPASAALGSGPNDWACTRDNVTGLVWEVKTNSGLRHQNWTYSWYNPDPASNGGSAGYPDYGNNCFDPARCDTHKYVADVNSQGLCGARDWRLPDRFELESLMSDDRVNPAIDTTFFPNTPSRSFWSSSPWAYYAYYAWDVDFGSGGVDYDGHKTYQKYVRLVRGGQ